MATKNTPATAEDGVVVVKKPATRRAATKKTTTATEKKPLTRTRATKANGATRVSKTVKKTETQQVKKPVMLMILDGWGYRSSKDGNAIAAAKTPNLDKLLLENPHTLVGASGMDVGLPDGQMGNSEVGHTNMGAGRIVYQELTRITKAIRDESFYENEAMLGAIAQCKWFDSTLHIMGLMSDGGVHSHVDHICALIELAARNGLHKVCVHCFMDGRDTAPTSGAGYVAKVQQKIDRLGVGCIATVSGRYYAMDRDKRWDRVERAYDAIVRGNAPVHTDAVAAIKASYENGVTDEFIDPFIATVGGTIKSDDAVIFANFRPDRAREITRTLVDAEFDGFDRPEGNLPIHFVCMTQYDATMPNVNVAFKPQSLTNTLGEYLAANGKTQLRIAETEKYAHVTFFFNGGVEAEYENEDRALISSPSVATYDLQPAMSAVEVTDEVLARIASDKYDVIVLNYANCDMVGHTGIFDAAVAAVETVDTCVGRVVEAMLAKQGQILVTADHGNADQMLEEDGVSPFTAHSTNPVPLILVGTSVRGLAKDGVLADLAPTMLDLMGLDAPEEMTGKSLLIK